MNKKSIICLIATLGIIVSCFLMFSNNISSKLKLSSKYYNEGKYIEITSNEITNLKEETYLLFTYNNYCVLKIPCDKVFEDFMKKYKIDMLSMPFEEFKKTRFYTTVSYAPSVLIIQKDKIIAYLDANSAADLDKYQDSSEFAKWVEKYISLNK